MLLLGLQRTAILQLDWHSWCCYWPSSGKLLSKRPTGGRTGLLAFVAVAACHQALATAIIPLPPQQASKEAHPTVSKQFKQWGSQTAASDQPQHAARGWQSTPTSAAPTLEGWGRCCNDVVVPIMLMVLYVLQDQSKRQTHIHSTALALSWNAKVAPVVDTGSRTRFYMYIKPYQCLVEGNQCELVNAWLRYGVAVDTGP